MGTLKAFPPMRLNAVCLIYAQVDGATSVSSTEHKHERLHMMLMLKLPWPAGPSIPRLRSGCLVLISPGVRVSDNKPLGSRSRPILWSETMPRDWS
ncbi:hypothetical protein ASPBRDRAFT_449665 [Aspergillus brasiliensis CBS 101740]|uniref:Uncharacterized protein n=1 Tax=Aspergillus brasiliensis (strain CBS 101740 / IMI 381727 / IBT 21946) TaxID=767769 RepID=A0A1L9URU4_ASPBC|nr:hypothetical protein ASPBRDRAFT_449665 [Aspergillus brasiliensis CBS 101740]